MKKSSSSPLPPGAPRAEFDLLLEQLRSLEDLSELEPVIAAGLRRVGLSLAQETVCRVASKSASSPEAGFSPSCGR